MPKKNINNQLSRRDFIKLSSASTLPLMLTGFPIYAYAQPQSGCYEKDNDKVLVLIQLQGGNDGLNTLFDLNQYSNLFSVRSNIIVPENDVLSLEEAYGLHPSMNGMKSIWENDQLGIVQNVGYPNQNRSHFRSTDIWNTASSAEETITTGWLGRYLDTHFTDYPLGFPNLDCPHPFALTIGRIVSETCQGSNGNFSMALTDPFNPGTVLIGAAGEHPDNCYGDTLGFINEISEQTNAYSESISNAANIGNNLSTKYEVNGETDLATKLKHVARLISGGLETKVYIVQIGGFDTHDNQVVANNTQTGNHANLLQELSDAICAFQDDLNLLGVANRVCGMTYSEFGRRIRSNASFGTDHGTAAPLFLFGSCIKNQVLGDSPEIDTQVGINDGVPMQFDFRNVYGTILSQWLGASDAQVMDVLFPDYEPLPLFKEGCATSTNVEAISLKDKQINIYPNPCTEYVNLTFSGNNEVIKISLFNGFGSLIKVIAQDHFTKGNHQINLSVADLPTGSYFIYFETKGVRKTKKFVKGL